MHRVMKTSWVRLSLAALCLCSSAAAQSDGIGWSLDADGSATIVFAPEWISPGATNVDGLSGEVELRARVSRVLDNGAEIGLRFIGRAQTDAARRPGWAGVVERDVAAPVGGFTGVAAGPVPLDAGGRVGLEAAYLYVDGGLGELTLGRDRGIADRFHEGPEDAFRLARSDAALIDPSGRNGVRTRNDPTGVSAKLSYATPRLLGLRAGVSFTPDADEANGLDRQFEDALDRRAGLNRKQSVEGALSLSRRIGRDGPRINASLGYTLVDIAPVSPAAQDLYKGQVETWSAGGSLELENVTLGASWLESNDGVRGSDYSAWTVGASRDVFGWRAAIVYGEASDLTAGVDAETFSVGANKDLDAHLRLAIGYRSDGLSGGLADRGTSGGIVIEITLFH